MTNWLKELTSLYASGAHSTFIVTGNVRDMGENDVVNVLTKLGEKNFALTVRWDKANGFAFEGQPDESVEKLFTVKGPFGEQVLDPAQVVESEQALGIIAGILNTMLPKSIGVTKEGVPLTRPLTRKVLVVIDYAEAVLPEAQMAILRDGDKRAIILAQKWGQPRSVLSRGGHLLVLVTNAFVNLHSDVRSALSHYAVVRVPYPTHEERLSFLESYEELPLLEGSLEVKEIANLTSGLNFLQLDDILLQARLEGILTRILLKRMKDAVIKSEFADVLEPMYPSRGFEIIGGLDHVKEFFQKSVIEPMRVGPTARVPQGVLMTGPAGTGKTVMAESVAYEAKINAVKLNLAKVFGRYVGDSERNLERALEGIISMAPTIVFIDEVDQQVRRGESGDSGVSNRVFSRLLEVMSDTSLRGRIIFLAATNRPDLMDAAMKRPGRFDKKIPFFPPETVEERWEIIRAFCMKYGGSTALAEVGVVLSDTEGWTGAELEVLFLKAKELSDDGGFIGATAWDMAFVLIVPTTQEIERMTELALLEVSDLSLVPEKYHERVRSLRSSPAPGLP